MSSAGLCCHPVGPGHGSHCGLVELCFCSEEGHQWRPRLQAPRGAFPRERCLDGTAAAAVASTKLAVWESWLAVPVPAEGTDTETALQQDL